MGLDFPAWFISVELEVIKKRVFKLMSASYV